VTIKNQNLTSLSILSHCQVMNVAMLRYVTFQYRLPFCETQLQKLLDAAIHDRMIVVDVALQSREC